jgi:hypothetical protein
MMKSSETEETGVRKFSEQSADDIADMTKTGCGI